MKKEEPKAEVKNTGSRLFLVVVMVMMMTVMMMMLVMDTGSNHPSVHMNIHH